MSTATATGTTTSTWDRVRTFTPPPRYLPIIATLALFIGLFSVGGVKVRTRSQVEVGEAVAVLIRRSLP